MAFIGLEDGTGSLDCTVFPKLFAENPDLWTEDQALIIKGKVDFREEKLQIVVDSAVPVDTKKTPQDMIHEIFIKSGTSKTAMEEVSKLLKSHPGEHEIIIAIETGNNLKKITLPYKVDYDEKLEKRIEKTLHGW